jgi:hypothetical protein
MPNQSLKGLKSINVTWLKCHIFEKIFLVRQFLMRVKSHSDSFQPKNCSTLASKLIVFLNLLINTAIVSKDVN